MFLLSGISTFHSSANSLVVVKIPKHVELVKLTNDTFYLYCDLEQKSPLAYIEVCNIYLRWMSVSRPSSIITHQVNGHF